MSKHFEQEKGVDMIKDYIKVEKGDICNTHRHTPHSDKIDQIITNYYIHMCMYVMISRLRMSEHYNVHMYMYICSSQILNVLSLLMNSTKYNIHTCTVHVHIHCKECTYEERQDESVL